MTRPILFQDITVYSEGRERPHESVLVDGDRIETVAIGSLVAPDAAIVVRGDLRLAPGYVDTHIHGFGGYDVMRPGDVPALAGILAQYGVTAFLPATVAVPLRRLCASLAAIGTEPTGGARVLGIHAEGPFLSGQRPGMFDSGAFVAFDVETWHAMRQAARGAIRLMTIAPELVLPDDLSRLQDDGVTLSLGHSDASFADVNLAFRSGVRRCTHAFNAMRPFHHREPGVVGAMLGCGELDCELILDGHHVGPAAARLLLNTRTSGRVCLVSDAVPPAGLGDGFYTWLGYPITVADGQARVPEGNLAGSVLTLDQAVRNAVQLLDLAPARAVQLAGEYPLRSIGVDQGGRVEPGALADLVVLDAGLRPYMTVVGGRIVWRRDER